MHWAWQARGSAGGLTRIQRTVTSLIDRLGSELRLEEPDSRQVRALLDVKVDAEEDERPQHHGDDR
jgi:hypothetical protein